MKVIRVYLIALKAHKRVDQFIIKTMNKFGFLFGLGFQSILEPIAVHELPIDIVKPYSNNNMYGVYLEIIKVFVQGGLKRKTSNSC